MPKSRAVNAGQVQIVIPVRGAHDALRMCLDCLAATELPRCEIVVVCATDERNDVGVIVRTSALQTIGFDTRIELVVTNAPQTFAENVNMGARCGQHRRSEFIVLLNSDAFVGPGWLAALLAPFADPDVVAAGPMGTSVSGFQGGVAGKYRAFIEPDAQRTIESFAMATETFASEFRGATPVRSRRLVGFCVAVRRSAWDEIGGMDERFENAFCDDDLSLRLSLLGDCVVVPDLLVLHAGSASFAELPDAEANYRRVLVENEGRFAEKWGRRGLLPFLSAWFDSRGAR